jgi:hypothetical protein
LAKPYVTSNTFWAISTVSQDLGYEVVGDVYIYNDDGEAIVEVYGFRVRFLDIGNERDIS